MAQSSTLAFVLFANLCNNLLRIVIDTTTVDAPNSLETFGDISPSFLILYELSFRVLGHRRQFAVTTSDLFKVSLVFYYFGFRVVVARPFSVDLEDYGICFLY